MLVLGLNPNRPARAAELLVRDADGVLYLRLTGTLHSTDATSLAALGLSTERVRELPRRNTGLLPEGEPIPPLQDGSIVATPAGARYLLHQGLHQIPDDATLSAYGWEGGAEMAARPVLPVPAGLIAVAAMGAPLERATPGADHRRFDWGYCTWWVAQRRVVPWNGNAVEWYDNARALGYATGDQPLPGAILVRQSATWAGFGHVAYIESVDGTTFTVSEMNVNRLGEVTTATYDLAKGPPGLLGFIYWRYAPEPPPAAKPAERPRDRPE